MKFFADFELHTVILCTLFKVYSVNHFARSKNKNVGNNKDVTIGEEQFGCLQSH